MRKPALFPFALGLIGIVAQSACGGEEQPPPKAPETPPPAVSTAPVASAEPPKEPEKPKKSPAELQKDSMYAFVEAQNAHDSKKIAGVFTDGAILKVAGAPTDASGKEAIGQSYGKLFEAFPDMKTMPTRVFVKGDTVVTEWAFNGTHKGDLWGIKATEKPVGSMGLDVAMFTPEGQIKELHSYYDGNTILSQAGISKQKGRSIPTLPSKPEVIVSTGGPDEAKNIEVVKKLTEALNAKKEADFLAVLGDNIEYDDYTQPQGMKGKADAKKFFKEVTTGLPDGKHSIVNTVAVNDYVIAEEVMEGTHKGSFFGIPATKKPLNMKHVTVYQFKDAKLVKGWGFANGADMAQQLGLTPKPGAAPAGKPATPAKAGDKPAVTAPKPADKK